MGSELQPSQPASVPDLYELAFCLGNFSCDVCGMQLGLATLDAETGQIGTTEKNRQPPECLNGCGLMRRVTYREVCEEQRGFLLKKVNKVTELEGEQQALHALLDKYLTTHDTTLEDKVRQMLQCYVSYKDAVETMTAERKGKALIDLADLQAAQKQLRWAWGIEGVEPESVASLDQRISAAIKEATNAR